MNVLVPLPFDIACQAHGRNLRIVHLLRELPGDCRLTIAAAGESVAAGAAGLLPEARIVAMPRAADVEETAPPGKGWTLGRMLRFFGHDRAFQAWIDRLSARADAVLGFDVPGALCLSQIPGTPTLCDLIDDPWLTCRSGSRSERWSTAGLKSALAIRALRRRVLPRIDMLAAVAPGDARSLARATGRDVRVVPNGVELPDGPESVDRRALVVFTGAMSFGPNEQAACHLARNIWPRIRAASPGATLALVGADPTDRVQALAGIPGILVTGRVESIGDWLRQARVATAPMCTGTGLKNKILEACAHACPVVATPMALNGIPAGEAEGIVVAGSAEAFAREVSRLLADPQAGERIGRAGRAMVANRFSWSRSGGMLREMLKECARPVTGPGLDPMPRTGEEAVLHAAT
jgi:glycosyltransferase involved in cell wall biosynthesis